MAVNFFFNTGDRHHTSVVISDEPWSRPGDYVLLRALTDLVCVSSACPDDIDAGQWLEPDRHPCPHLFGRGKILSSRGHTHDSRRRADHDPRDRLSAELREAHPQLRRVQGLLAAQLLRQGRADRGVLGLPREGGGDRPVAAAQIRGHRPGCRGAAAILADARREAGWPSARWSIRPCATSMAA